MTTQAPQQELLLNRLRNIANGVRIYGAPDKDLLADRLLVIASELAESEEDMELTDAQILTLWEETYVQRGWTGIEFARAIERAHGIGVKP